MMRCIAWVGRMGCRRFCPLPDWLRQSSIIWVWTPKNRIATIEKVAVNILMAGCVSEFVPSVITALQGMLDDDFDLNGVQATTICISPLTIEWPLG